MNKYGLFTPHLIMLISTVLVVVSIRTDWESKVVTLFWLSFAASLLAVPPISKENIALGYVAVFIPFVIFIMMMSLKNDKNESDSAIQTDHTMSTIARPL